MTLTPKGECIRRKTATIYFSNLSTSDVCGEELVVAQCMTEAESCLGCSLLEVMFEEQLMNVHATTLACKHDIPV